MSDKPLTLSELEELIQKDIDLLGATDADRAIRAAISGAPFAGNCLVDQQEERDRYYYEFVRKADEKLYLRYTIYKDGTKPKIFFNEGGEKTWFTILIAIRAGLYNWQHTRRAKE